MNARLRSNSFSRCNGIAPVPFYLQYILPLPLLPSTYISGNHCSLIRVWKIPSLAREACSSHSLGRPFNLAENAFVFLPHLLLNRKTETRGSSSQLGRSCMCDSKVHDTRLVSWPLRSGACNFYLHPITAEAKREVMDVLKRCKNKKKSLFLLNHWSEDITRTSAFRWWCSRCQVAEENPANLSDFGQIQPCGLTRAQFVFPLVGIVVCECGKGKMNSTPMNTYLCMNGTGKDQ